jgi:DNA-binding HxlR family transcriptional regulator
MTNLEEIDKSLNDWKFYELHSIMGKKWNLLILIAIYEDIHTFSWIMKAIPKINTSILTKRLNELVNKWFITKTSKIWYNLSEKWNLLMEWLESLKQRVIETGRDKQIEKYKKIK